VVSHLRINNGINKYFVMDSVVNLIVSLVNMLFSGVNGNKSKKSTDSVTKVTKLIVTFMVVSMILVSFIFSMNYFISSGNKDSGCADLRLSFDTLNVKYAKLHNDLRILKIKYDNVDFEKYPFDISCSDVLTLQDKIDDLVLDVGATRANISIFHNPRGVGYTPRNINGHKMYMYSSQIVSSREGYIGSYDNVLYQNVPLIIFNDLFESGLDRLVINKGDVRDVDMRLLMLLYIDYDKVQTSYLYGIPNLDNIKKYGKFAGVLVIDEMNGNKITTRDGFMVDKTVEDISEYLSERRRKEDTGVFSSSVVKNTPTKLNCLNTINDVK